MSDGASSLPRLCLIDISQTLAALTKTAFLLSAIAAPAAVERIELLVSHQSRTCVSRSRLTRYYARMVQEDGLVHHPQTPRADRGLIRRNRLPSNTALPAPRSAWTLLWPIRDKLGDGLA